MKKCPYCLEMVDDRLEICSYCDMYLMETSTEKRKHPRFGVSFVVKYKDVSDPMSKWDVAQARNISQGGLSFSISKKFPQNTILSTIFEPPIFAGGAPIESLAKVQHIEGTKMIFNAGVNFIELGEEAKRKISEFLAFLSK